MKQFVSRVLIALGLLPLSPDMVRAAAGDLYVAIYQQNSLYEINPAGTQSTVASGFNQPLAVAVDATGTVFIGQTFNGEVKKVTNGVVSTLTTLPGSFPELAIGRLGHLFATQRAAGTIVEITSNNGTQSTYASGFKEPDGLAFDKNGNLFVAENGYGGNVSIISKTTPGGVRTTFASGFYNAEGLAFDPAGNLYLAETGHSTIYKFTPDGTKTLFTSAIPLVRNLAFDAAGNLFVSGGGGSNAIYKVTPSGSVSVFKSGIAANGIAFEPPLGQPVNIATRMSVQTGENVLIGGFIIAGGGGKSVVIRGIGPSLTAAGVPNALQDPIIELHYPSGAVVTNDNWQDTQGSAIQATGLAPKDSRESAFSYNLSPGNYTVVLKGKNNTTGIGLIEVYDYDPGAISKLANISTRGLVGTGDNVMIGGFILGANGARVIVRAIGPSLTQAGIAGALSDTKLSLRNVNGTELAANDDWQDSQKAEIQATGVPPSNSLESAIVATVPNGNYTAIVSGYQGATGVGLVEVYNLQ